MRDRRSTDGRCDHSHVTTAWHAVCRVLHARGCRRPARRLRPIVRYHRGYSQGTPRVLTGYSQGTHRVLAEHSMGSVRLSDRHRAKAAPNRQGPGRALHASTQRVPTNAVRVLATHGPARPVRAVQRRPANGCPSGRAGERARRAGRCGAPEVRDALADREYSVSMMYFFAVGRLRIPSAAASLSPA
jgi:hypothetical protein